MENMMSYIQREARSLFVDLDPTTFCFCSRVKLSSLCSQLSIQLHLHYDHPGMVTRKQPQIISITIKYRTLSPANTVTSLFRSLTQVGG